MSQIRIATDGIDFEIARHLFLEYAKQLDFSLCFQDFDKELENLERIYGVPDGILLLVIVNERPVGCVGMRKLEDGICEMKRLYIQPEFRQGGLGRKLVETLIEHSRRIGYRFMRLDTIGATMKTAVELYLKLGFYEIPPYRHNPIEGALYLELDLGAVPLVKEV